MASAAHEDKGSARRDEVVAWLAALAGAVMGMAGALALVLTGLLAGPAGAAAHPMPETRVWMDSSPTGVRLTLQMPLNRLEFAFGQPLAASPERVLPLHSEALSRYLLQHVGARSQPREAATDGDLGSTVGWQALAPVLRIVGDAPNAELEAVMELRAPAQADARHFELLMDVVTHEVRTHRALVYLRNDWLSGHVNVAPLWLGGLDAQTRTLAVDLPEPAAAGGHPAEGQSATPPGGPSWRGWPGAASWRRLMAQGAHHIAEGTDHLLFLLTLLLVAPLAAHRRRWALARPPAAAMRQIVAVVSAFTAGHSLTLALGNAGWVTPPAQAVEALVAASIIVAAVQAWRPFTRSAGAVMAGGFGLLHGLAFAGSLSGAGLDASQRVQALLAFNLGIEAMQLGVVAVAMPPLLVLARHVPRAYAGLRAGGAALAALAAGIWLADRLGAPVEPLTAAVERTAALAPALGAGLWLVAGLATARALRAGRPGEAGSRGWPGVAQLQRSIWRRSPPRLGGSTR